MMDYPSSQGTSKTCGRRKVEGEDGSSTKRKQKTYSKDKSPTMCYECKKPGHFKVECSFLKVKRKFFRNKNHELMATWEDIDL